VKRDNIDCVKYAQESDGTAHQARLRRHVGLWETGAMPYLFDAGRRAARAQLSQITVLLRDALPPISDIESLAA
jgi:hypothetical protein